MKTLKRMIFGLVFIFGITATNFNSISNAFTFSMTANPYKPLGGDIVFWTYCIDQEQINFITVMENGPGSGNWMYSFEIANTYLYTPPLPSEVTLGQAYQYYVACTCDGYTCGPGGKEVRDIGTGWR